MSMAEPSTVEIHTVDGVHSGIFDVGEAFDPGVEDPPPELPFPTVWVEG